MHALSGKRMPKVLHDIHGIEMYERSIIVLHDIHGVEIYERLIIVLHDIHGVE
jgi:bifunctional N-acetylglucosamine-1-phosphate-uridyltransferase/glucosamine-1-phosphate-acetyltransferase GlmU-like protein